jgi:hypothetical protein
MGGLRVWVPYRFDRVLQDGIEVIFSRAAFRRDADLAGGASTALQRERSRSRSGSPATAQEVGGELHHRHPDPALAILIPLVLLVLLRKP